MSSVMRKRSCFELALEGERLCKDGDVTNAVQMLEEAVNIGTDNFDVLGIVYRNLGNAYLYLGNFEKALQYHQHDCTLARTLEDLNWEGKARFNLANTMKNLGQFDNAISCCQRYLEIAHLTENKAELARALYCMGNIHHLRAKQDENTTALTATKDPAVLSDLKLALDFYKQNLKVAKELNDRAALGRTYGSLGNTFYLMGDGDEAISHHTQRLAIAKEFGDKAAQRRAYTNLGNTNIFLMKYETAADFYLQTLTVSRQLGNRAFEAQACYSLGSTYTLLGDFQQAIEYHMRHKEIAEELKDSVGVGRACWLLSNAHMSLGNTRQALDFTEQQLKISTQIGDEGGRRSAEENLEELHKMMRETEDESLLLPRVRRISMEHMDLLRLTPSDKKGTPRRNMRGISEEALPYEDNSAPSSSDKNGKEHHVNGVHSLHEVNGRGEGAHDKFFDLLTRVQGKRMNDQRCEMQGDSPPPVDLNHQEDHLRPRVPDVNPVDEVENHQKMNHMIAMLERSQSKRLDEQRVSLSTLPGLRMNPDDPDHPASDPHDNGEKDNPDTSLNDEFLDNLMRCQNTRLNDQRTSAPPADTLTTPDEDFISLIVRMQSSRIEDQRCKFDMKKG